MTCGRHIHWEKKFAKKKAREQSKYHGKRFIEYYCDDCAGWHIGVPPPELIRGEITRDQITRSAFTDH